jgi:hypothetical protein
MIIYFGVILVFVIWRWITTTTIYTCTIHAILVYNELIRKKKSNYINNTRNGELEFKRLREEKMIPLLIKIKYYIKPLY